MPRATPTQSPSKLRAREQTDGSLGAFLAEHGSERDLGHRGGWVRPAQSKAAGPADAPPQCADVGNAYDPLERSVEKTYQKAIAHEQNEINSRIAELASADRAKKPELIKHIEAREAEILVYERSS